MCSNVDRDSLRNGDVDSRQHAVVNPVIQVDGNRIGGTDEAVEGARGIGPWKCGVGQVIGGSSRPRTHRDLVSASNTILE